MNNKKPFQLIPDMDTKCPRVFINSKSTFRSQRNEQGEDTGIPTLNLCLPIEHLNEIVKYAEHQRDVNGRKVIFLELSQGQYAQGVKLTRDQLPTLIPPKSPLTNQSDRIAELEALVAKLQQEKTGIGVPIPVQKATKK